MSLMDKITKYFVLKEEITQMLSELVVEDDMQETLNKDVLYQLMKDSHFEVRVFEIMLHIDSESAIDYIKKFYLVGELEDKSRFKGNLDVLLEDYKEVLGMKELKRLIDSLPESAKKFTPIQNAIKFVLDE